MIWMICILSLSHGLTNIRSKTPTIFFPLVENCIVFLMFFLQTLASRVQACACACAFIIRPCLSYECCPFRIFRDESLTFEYLRRYIYYNIYTIPHPFLSIPSCRCEGTLHSVTFTWNWKRMNRYLMTCFNSQVCWHGTNCALSISVSYLFFLCLSLSVVFASDFYLSHLLSYPCLFSTLLSRSRSAFYIHPLPAALFKQPYPRSVRQHKCRGAVGCAARSPFLARAWLQRSSTTHLL